MTHLLSLFYEKPPTSAKFHKRKARREKEILYAKKLAQNHHPSRSATKHIDPHSTTQTLIFCVDRCVRFSPSSFSLNSKDKVEPAMVFSSSPLHLDPPKWNQQPSGINIQSDPLQILSSQPPPAAGGSGGAGSIRPGSMVDRARMAQLPLPEPGLKCPRCDSTNTKFCYFNNYNLSQPRHFCKACRRYWTRGGALRNVPVGGGCRRNKRSRGRNKSAPATQRRAGGAATNSGVSSSPNTNTNSLSSQMLMLPPPPQPSFFPGLHHLNGYVGDFGLNLGGGGEVDQFEMGANRSSGVSRIHQLSNFFSGSDLTGSGLYPFQGSATQLDDTTEFGEAGRVKMEGNNGVSLPNNMMGAQGDDDQYGGGWGSGNGWADISGFHGSSSTGHLL